MKKNLLSMLLIGSGMFLCGSAIAQEAPDWASVIAETRGDTVVVKSTTTSTYINTVRTAVVGDTTATGERTNPNRVYETVPGEYYISDVSLELDATVPNLVLTAPIPKDGGSPPVHVRALQPDGRKDKTFIQAVGNIYVENQYYCGTFSTDDSYESEFERTSLNSRCVVNNCIFDLTRWTLVLPLAQHASYFFTNCKFINIGHEASVEKGVVVETRTLPPDTVWMENNTIINSGGFIMSLENSAPTFAYFNHNTIVNCAQGPFLFHSAAEYIVANNLLVNAGIIPDYPGFYALFDDDDQLPKGIVNSDTIDEAWKGAYWDNAYPFAEADRKLLMDRNAMWWDSRFTDMVATGMTPVPDSLGGKWVSQMFPVNDRTQAMFDDDTNYPYYVEGTTILGVEPTFGNLADRVPEWISWVVSNCVANNPNQGDFMPNWRTNAETNMYIIDWPMLADMSYTNTELLTAGYGDLPLGDLNWFPTAKATWDTQNEPARLIEAMKAGKLLGIEAPKSAVNSSNSNIEVFPNPVSKDANVKFNLANAGKVDLAIYNVMGQLVRTVELGLTTAGSHEVVIERGNLGQGIYFLNMNINSEKVSSKKFVIE